LTVATSSGSNSGTSALFQSFQTFSAAETRRFFSESSIPVKERTRSISFSFSRIFARRRDAGGD
jgi:hypothetical protein